MASISKHINLIKIAIVLFVPYIFDFIFLPLILSNFRGYVLTYTSIIFKIVFSIIGMALLTDKFRYWLLSDLAYHLLATLYHPPGIYGIGMLGISLASSPPPSYDRTSAWLGITICTIGNFLIQFTVWICFKIFKMVKAHLKKKKSEA